MIFIDLLLVAIGVALVIPAFLAAGKRRLAGNLVTSKVRSVAMGMAELKGVAKPDKPLESPFSKTPCVYYRYSITNITRTRNQEFHTPGAGGESSSAFYLEDETGSILVYPKGAKTELSNCQIVREENREVKEYCLLENSPLYVAGTVGKKKDFAAGDLDVLKHFQREAAQCRANIEHVETNPREWTSDEARENAKKTFLGDLARLTIKIRELEHKLELDMTEELAIGKSSEDGQMLIADCSEEVLDSKLSSSVTIGLMAAGFFLLLGLISFGAHTGVLPHGLGIAWDKIAKFFIRITLARNSMRQYGL